MKHQNDKNICTTRAGKNLGFLDFFRFLICFLGFNVRKAEHTYMTHYK